MPGALAPYRALDLTAEIGALTTRLLAGFGVDVIRVEPEGGHPSRRRGPFVTSADGETSGSLYWAQLNAGKRSVTLDLDDDEDQERLRELARGADFLFESDAPGVMASRGLGFEDLAAIAPQLIYVSMTPFGQSGPKAHWAASDLIGAAAGGLMSLVGDRDRAPLRPSVEQAYALTALNAGSAAMIALHARHVTGRGQHVDVSMQAAMANTLGNARLFWEMDGIETKRAGGARAFAERATRIVYPSADGYVAFIRIPRGMPDLARWMRAEGVEPRFDVDYWANRSIAGSVLPDEAEIAELEAEIAAFFAARGSQQLYETGQRHRVLICPVNTMQDLVESPQLSARAFFCDVEDPALGRLRSPGAPAVLSQTPWVERPAPTLGADNDQLAAIAAERQQRR